MIHNIAKARVSLFLFDIIIIQTGGLLWEY